jgi:heme/copper-type cytochrome/quinol oxidase subunit 4
MNNLLLAIWFGLIFLSPMWIHVVSGKHWKPSTKKICIVAMVIISAGATIYGFLRSQTDSSPLWIWHAFLILFFVAVVLSAYFNWPRERKVSEKMPANNPKVKPARKNRAYVSLPLLTGSDGDASVAFHNATFQKVNESGKRFPDPDFGAWLIKQIYQTNKILAESTGVLKRKFFCPSCGTELSPEGREQEQKEFELRYKDFAPFIMQITIPSVMCPQCSRICGIDLDGSLNYHLNEAILHAFGSENILP